MQSLACETIGLASSAGCAPGIANFAVGAKPIVEIVIHACAVGGIRISVFALAAQAVGFILYARRTRITTLRAVCLSVIVIAEVADAVSALVQSMSTQYTFFC